MVITERKSAAKALGITERSLGDWKKQPGFPDTSAGYDIDAIQRWREAHQRKGSVESDQMLVVNKAIKLEKLKETQRKNRLLELEIQEEEGKLLPRHLYEAFIASLLSGLGDWCEQLPSLIETEVPAKYGKKVRTRIEKELRDMRDRLAEELKREPAGA